MAELADIRTRLMEATELECDACAGHGVHVWTETVAECCGRPRENGECCQTPVAGQIECSQECPVCDGFGTLPTISALSNQGEKDS